MRVINLNLNGIRSATKKGFLSWASEQNADFICVQETRAYVNQYLDGIFSLPGYYNYFHDAKKRGYSGVGIYSKHKPEKVIYGLGWPIADEEGRYVELKFPQINIASLYLPSGTSSEERQNIKFDFLQRYFKYLQKIIESKENYIIAGDINIAHKTIDLKNWRSNQNHTGFLPEERLWLDKVFDELGFIDAFRVVNKDPDQYTWWSNFGRAWEKNVGWRIDYQIITPGLKSKVKSASIYKDQRFSDHSPLIMDYAT
ncbi:MAG: exodeoxyribonuclease III [Gammaproteobacteria bacterium]|jgi:exodeoxyribonuclease-3